MPKKEPGTKVVLGRTVSDLDDPALERRLWQHVILRAQQEAVGSYVYGGDEKVIQYMARRWLITRSRSFLLVCNMAGFDLEKTEKLLKENRRRYATRNI